MPGKAGRTLKAGDIVGGDYELLYLLGEGGMGVVYRCRHRIIDREYALKILKPSQINEQRWQRFQVEARSIAKLDHPNIVKIFNMGIDNGDCPYYVMELLDGKSLDQYIGTEELLNLNTTLDIFKQLAAGLGYAHSKGIIHRDIKPDNIVIENNAASLSAKIVDFGIVKLLHRDTIMQQGLTSAGQVFGTPLYMSPEQSQGGEIDERADIYSLGCTFFKTLTGKYPFLGKTAMETVMMHQTEPPPTLFQTSGNIHSPELEEIIERMLAKHPDDRYQSMEQVGHDFERLAQGKTLSKITVGPASLIRSEADTAENFTGEQRNSGSFRTRLSIGIASLLIVAVALSGYFYSLSHPPNLATGGNTAEGNEANLDGNPPDKDPSTTGDGKSEAQKTLEAEQAAFDSFKSTPTVAFTQNGKHKLKIFFPRYSIGKLRTKNCEDKEARGTVVISDSRPITLEVRELDRAIWAYPSILKKIDRSAINELAFTSNALAEVNPGAEQSLEQMLQAAHTWTNFDGIHFMEFHSSTRVPELLNGFTHLRRFSMANSGGTAEELASLSFVKELHFFDVSSVKNVDLIIEALSNSKNIEILDINETNPSPKALLKLETCPNLWRLSIGDTTLSSAQLTAISKLTSVRSLVLRGTNLSPKELFVLKGMKNFEQVQIDHWTDEQVAQFKRIFLHCNVVRQGQEQKSNYANEFGYEVKQ